MRNVKFISVTCIVNDVEIRKFINVNHILEIYQDQNNIVIVFTSGGCILLPNQNINVFMDRIN